MILRQWIPLQFMCSAAWLASVALLCLAEDQTIKMLRDPSAVLKTVCLLHQHIFPPVLCTAKLAKATAQGLQVLWVPLLQTSAKDQWMPSCFLPKNTELNILRCIQGKTTGNGIKICVFFFFVTDERAESDLNPDSTMVNFPCPKSAEPSAETCRKLYVFVSGGRALGLLFRFYKDVCYVDIESECFVLVVPV